MRQNDPLKRRSNSVGRVSSRDGNICRRRVVRQRRASDRRVRRRGAISGKSAVACSQRWRRSHFCSARCSGVRSQADSISEQQILAVDGVRGSVGLVCRELDVVLRSDFAALLVLGRGVSSYACRTRQRRCRGKVVICRSLGHLARSVCELAGEVEDAAEEGFGEGGGGEEGDEEELGGLLAKCGVSGGAVGGLTGEVRILVSSSRGQSRLPDTGRSRLSEVGCLRRSDAGPVSTPDDQ